MRLVGERPGQTRLLIPTYEATDTVFRHNYPYIPDAEAWSTSLGPQAQMAHEISQRLLSELSVDDSHSTPGEDANSTWSTSPDPARARARAHMLAFGAGRLETPNQDFQEPIRQQQRTSIGAAIAISQPPS